jgi:hypothetical protein
MGNYFAKYFYKGATSYNSRSNRDHDEDGEDDYVFNEFDANANVINDLVENSNIKRVDDDSRGDDSCYEIAAYSSDDDDRVAVSSVNMTSSGADVFDDDDDDSALSSAFLDDNSDSVEFVKVTNDGPDTRNATSSDDDVKFVKVEPGPPHHLSTTRNHNVSLSQISDCALSRTKRRAEEAPAAYGGAERKRRANYGHGYSIAFSTRTAAQFSDDYEHHSILASSKDGDGDNNVNKDSRKDDCGALPGTKRCADEESRHPWMVMV